MCEKRMRSALFTFGLEDPGGPGWEGGVLCSLSEDLSFQLIHDLMNISHAARAVFLKP